MIPRTVPLLIALGLARAAVAQCEFPAVFVANNGNLEGSVTSYRLNADGTVAFLSKFIIGSTPSTSMPVPGTNATGIDLTPDGRFLAVSHATSATVFEQLTILRVNPDASTSLVRAFQTPDSPLDLVWLSDTLLAVTLTNLSAPNKVIVYRFADGSPATLTELARYDTGAFSSYLATDRDRRFLFAQSTGPNTVTAFAVQPDGSLTTNGPVASGPYPLGQGFIVYNGHAGLYAGGGISSGSHAVVGFHFDPATNTLTPQPGSPYYSPGTSPKQVLGSTDGRFAFVAHGTDATIRVLAVDQDTGALTDTGFAFDVGFQGSLGEMQVIRQGDADLLLVTDRDTIEDGVRGLLPLRVGPAGQLTPTMIRVDSQASTPNQFVIWPGPSPCCVDYFPDGEIDFSDIEQFLAAYIAQVPGSCAPGADLNNDGEFDFSDIEVFLALYNAGC